MGKIKKNKETDKPEEGKVYALTGAAGTACIANGNTWKESEVKDDQQLVPSREGADMVVCSCCTTSLLS